MRIKEIMKELSVRQQDLADRMGVSLSAIKQMVNAPSMTTATAEKIADALGVPVWQLFASPEDVAKEIKGDQQPGEFLAVVINGKTCWRTYSLERAREYINRLAGE